MTTIRFTDLPEALQSPAREYCADIGLTVSDTDGVPVSCRAGDCLAVEGTAGGVTLTYRKTCELFRALSFLPTFLTDGKPVRETARYRLLSYMGDCSRNAVFNVPFAKQMIRYLAGMGYDSMMLYTEDTYELPGYPYFGHMRGRFTAAELRELDDYAYSFGLELIPCVQSLAHLATALRWPDFSGYTDTGDILMVGDERTYRFIEAVLRQMASCFRSRRINLGMDEAHMIGCGEYLKRNGYRKPSDIMLEHLDRVVALCREVGFRPMIWSDMFFRMAFGGRYYTTEGEIPQDVIDRVPEELELIYWDYYTTDRNLCDHMMMCHKKFRNPVLFAGGAWKWHGFGAHNAFSIKSSEIQLDTCEKYGVDEILVTGWGDDGGEAAQVSNLASILYFAERCYHGRTDRAWLDVRSRQCFLIPIADLLAFDLPNSLPECSAEVTDCVMAPAKDLFFNDPLERLCDCHMVRETVGKEYHARAERLLLRSDNEKFGYGFEALGRLCEMLELKATLGWQLYDAYRTGDRAELGRLAHEVIPEILERTERFLVAFRKQWYHENKTFGFSAQEIRIGGLKERLRSTALRVEDYLAGGCDRIEELESAPLPMDKKRNGEYAGHFGWRRVVAPGLL